MFKVGVYRRNIIMDKKFKVLKFSINNFTVLKIEILPKKNLF